jgi:hypothetical protein
MREEILKLVNHEPWIECEENRAYLKWGHYPKTEGKLDPLCIKRAFVIDLSGEKPVVVGSDKESSSKGGLFLEFEADELYMVAVELDKGIYSVTDDNKWIFGDRRIAANYNVRETRWLKGFAKAYVGKSETKPFTAGFEFEIVPEVVKSFKAEDKLKVQLIFREKAVNGVLNVGTKDGVEEITADGFAEVTLKEGVNLMFARYVDEMPTGTYDKRNLTSTLTLFVR